MARKNNLIPRLKHKITIEKAVETEDAYGDIIQTWETVTTVRAGIQHMMGREYYAAQQVNAEQTVRFRIRYSRLIEQTKTKMRLKHNTRYFDIQAIQNVDERNHEMIIMATEDV